MKIWICTTISSIFGPLQGAARLYAYMKKNGHEVYLKDLNQNSYFTLLSTPNLETTFEKLKNNLDSFTRNISLRKEIGSILYHSSNGNIVDLLKESGQKRIKAENIVYDVLESQEFLLSKIDESNKIIDLKFLGLPADEFLKNYCILLCGKALIDAAFFPSQIDFGLGFTGIEYSTKVEDILRSIYDEKHNFLLPFYIKDVVPELKKENPDVVGLSITHTSDIIPALSLARLIKNYDNDIHICLGGATITEIAYRVQKNPALWQYFDSIVLGPGEVVFSQLIENLESNKDLSNVPNLILKKNGEIKKSSKVFEFDINKAVTPEYDRVRPQSVLPLETASGCYWGKCIFCYYPRQGTPEYAGEYNQSRVRDIELVFNDIDFLQKKYSPSFIGITDSSLASTRIIDIVEHNLKQKEKSKFSAFVRFEKDFKSLKLCEKMAEGGFLGVQVGLESGSQKVNDIINKGIKIKDASSIIRNFNRTGILLHLYTLVGIPGEHLEDAYATYNFLKRNHNGIKLGWQVYPLYVLENGPINERAIEYGINSFRLPDDYLSQFMFYQATSGMSQEESQFLAIKFTEDLLRFGNPLLEIMDIESTKIFLLSLKAKGLETNSDVFSSMVKRNVRSLLGNAKVR